MSVMCGSMCGMSCGICVVCMQYAWSLSVQHLCCLFLWCVRCMCHESYCACSICGHIVFCVCGVYVWHMCCICVCDMCLMRISVA